MKDDETIEFSVNNDFVLNQPIITAANIPFHMITLSNPEGLEAHIDFNGDKVVYTGDLDVDEAAKMFFDHVLKYYVGCNCAERLREEQEEKDNYELCPDCGQKSVKTKMNGIECTNSDCNYWFCY